MTVSVTSTEAHEGPVSSGFWALTLGSIGVVFGDIGTSLLYAFREAVAGAAQGQPVNARDCAWGFVADPVGTSYRRHRKIRSIAAARRQQRRGWLAAMGLVHIRDDPSVLVAINPWYGIHFLLSHGMIGMVTLGAVFLAVTGGEALYADLGHFGRKPIQAAWLYFVLPSLLINYFGQGALVFSNPAAIENSFCRMAPEILLLPLVVLATAATVIASQAVITGAYSLVRQAVQLGLLPRFEVRYPGYDLRIYAFLHDMGSNSA
jgi:K+ transporter